MKITICLLLWNMGMAEFQSSPVQNPLNRWFYNPVQSKSIWTGLDFQSSGLIQSISYSACEAMILNVNKTYTTFLWFAHMCWLTWTNSKLFVSTLFMLTANVSCHYCIEHMMYSQARCRKDGQGRYGKFGDICPFNTPLLMTNPWGVSTSLCQERLR